MAYELIYTSVPNGLQLGSSGFCTAAMSNGMSPALVQKLESLSGYKPCFSHNDANYAQNPVSYFHYVLRIGGENLSVLARVCSSGLDYTKRSNKLAHFLVVGNQEKLTCSAGPASFASAKDAFVESWNGQPRLFQSERMIAGRPYQARVAAHWGACSGDPGWAGWLAQSFLDDPKNVVFVIFDPLRHGDILELVDESLQLLPEDARWKVTFNTYMSNLTADSSCNWRFCTDDKEALRACGWTPQSVVLDLRGQLPPANPGNLVEQARTGNIPQAKRPLQVAVSPEVRAAANSAGSLSLNELRRKKAEEEAAAAAEKQRQEEARNKKMRLKDNDRRKGADDGASLGDAELREWNYRNILVAQNLNRKLTITNILLICFVTLTFALQGAFYFFGYLPNKKELRELSAQVAANSEALKKQSAPNEAERQNAKKELQELSAQVATNSEALKEQSAKNEAERKTTTDSVEVQTPAGQTPAQGQVNGDKNPARGGGADASIANKDESGTEKNAEKTKPSADKEPVTDASKNSHGDKNSTPPKAAGGGTGTVSELPPPPAAGGSGNTTRQGSETQSEDNLVHRVVKPTPSANQPGIPPEVPSITGNPDQESNDIVIPPTKK